MYVFKDQITLARNKRGCYILDTIKGCSGCNSKKPRGCYGDCYAWSITRRYGRDFSRIVKRDFTQDENQVYLFDFIDGRNTSKICRQIENIQMPFLRIGELGDPSEDWEHTFNICKMIAPTGKPIVIVTKHWKTIPNQLLEKARGIVFNTSISALDSEEEIDHRLTQYERLNGYGKSILRIVSCDFNTETPEGRIRAKIQEELFRKKNCIDTIFRPSKNNPLVVMGIIKTCVAKFLHASVLVSSHVDNPYLGSCVACPDMCGLTTTKGTW